MITPSFGLTATERVLPKLALDFTTAVLDSRITFTRTTDATHPATYINSSGVITSATNNQPRFDYDPTALICNGLLIEESRTNLLLNSLINGTILSTQVVTLSATTHTLSFYGTGTVTLSGGFTAVVTGTGTYPNRKTFTFTPIIGALTVTVTGTVQYAQLEAGAFATSYIPTTTTSLTRNADVATMTGTNFSSWFNATEGAFVAEAISNAISGNNEIIFGVSQDASNYMRFGRRVAGGTSTNIAGIVFVSSTQAYIGSGPVSAGVTYKTCFTYKKDNFNIATNGGAVVNDNAGNIPSAPIEAQIGSNAGASAINGYVKKVFYYPLQLTSAETQAFSK